MTNRIKPYKKAFSYSYTSGAYATIELVKRRPEIIESVYIHTDFRDHFGLAALCSCNNIPCITSDKVFSTVRQKENSYVLGVFRKYPSHLQPDQPHIIMVNPSDMGNLGTIIRTITGLGIRNLGVIEPAADIWHPKTVRASMGALFHIQHECFPDFETYTSKYPEHDLFPFMLEGDTSPEECSVCSCFSLVFGNEASGLDDRFRDIGQSVKIPLRENLDSFNLAVAVAVGTYVFARKTGLV